MIIYRKSCKYRHLEGEDSRSILQYGCYSERRLVTGLAIAAFAAWKLTVSRATNKASAPAPANIHPLRLPDG